MQLSPLTLETLAAIKREAIDVLTWENPNQAALDAAEALIKAVDDECNYRVNWANDVWAALAASR